MVRRLLCLGVLLCVVRLWAETPYLQGLLTAAKPGQTVALPPGVFHGGLTVPAGVSVKGAGYGKTVLDATGATNGLTLTGSGATISDLTVRGATVADISVQDAMRITLARVRATGALIGIRVQGGQGVRVENAIADGNRYGIIVSGVGHTVANSTAVGNASLGLSLPSGKDLVAFNNLVTDSTVAVNVGDVPGLVLDHNLYLGLNIGKCPKRAEQRESLNDWQYVSGLDRHSVNIPVTFDNAAIGRYAVVSTLTWALDRTVSAGWGTVKLAGRTAPGTDIDGVKRPSTPGVGAFETVATAPRRADGTFTVPPGEGLVSAGVFDAKNKLITYLFHTLPVTAGTHPFWLPARAYTGAPIGPGTYAVRVVKGDLRWKYQGWFGNTGHKDPNDYGAPCSHTGLAFDGDGRLFVGNVAADVYKNLRCADATGQWLWTLTSCAPMPGPGLSVAGDGRLYALRTMAGQGMCLTRIESATGTVIMQGNDGGQIPLKDGATFTGMTALGETFAYTDTKNNAVLFGTLATPAPGKTVAVPAPSCPAGDANTGVVWVISGGEKLVAVSSDGKIVAETTAVPSPVALAARDGVLAVASSKTGKVHLFDATNPAALQPLKTLGRGDGPDGRILSDRFLFQDNPGLSVDLALGPHGELAVADFFRMQVFAKDGTLRWGSWGIWGGGCVTSHVTPGRVYGGFGFTYLLDGEKGTWQPESYHRALAGTVNADAQIGGQTFVMMWGPGWTDSIVRFTPEKVTPVLALEQLKDYQYQWRRDTNGDGRVDEADTPTPVCDAKGVPVGKTSIFHHMFNGFLPDGTIIAAQRPTGNSWLLRWRPSGLDAQGVPVYKWEDMTGLPGADQVISPYSWKRDTQGIGQFEVRPGGGWLVNTNLTSSPACGHSVFNNGGTDVIGVAADGSTDWVHPFGNYVHIGGFTAGEGVCIAGMATTCDFHVIDRDGLGLPGFSTGSAWLDHVQALESFVDTAGKLNVLVTDCTKSCNDWVRLERCDLRYTSGTVTVSPAGAALLAGYVASPPDYTAGKPPKISFHVPHLKAPFAIDGNTQKWHDAGIAPQVIITPESGASNIEGGPRDCSILIRYAWEGKNLYMQALKFDDVICMPRNAQAACNWQDTLEMAINSYLTGMKFNLTLTQDEGACIYCDGSWQYRRHELAPEHVPRVFKVLNATDLPDELRLMENVTGVDMHDLKVEMFEAKLPIDAVTYEDFPDALWEVKPGAQMWLNYIIDDNDHPGAEAQAFIQWPPGAGTFMPKENGALAILDE